jgi:hypothetical protein
MIPSRESSKIPKWTVWSTRDTIDQNIPSIISIVETFLAVCLFGWIASAYETYLPLLISAAVAPLVLLRSEDSVVLGVKWFASWEKNLKVSESRAGEQKPVEIFVAFCIVLPLMPPYYAVAHRILAEAQGWNAFWLGFGLAWLLTVPIYAIGTAGSGLGYAPFMMIFRYGASRYGAPISACAISAANTSIPVLAGVFSATMLPLIGLSLMWRRRSVNAMEHEAFEKIQKYRSLPYNILYMPRFVGYALGVFLVSIIVRVGATIRFLHLGVQALPRNFWRLALCTSPKQVPELVPGLPSGETRFSLTSMLSEYRRNYESPRQLDRFAVTVVYAPVMALWFIPAWLYRFSLKGTAWLWWPLANLMSPPKIAKNPDWFHAQVMETRWSRNMRIFSYFSIITFVTVSLWRTLNEGALPNNPFLNAVGYALSIDWVSTPWQLLGVAGALLSLATVYLVDWDFRKYRVAVETRDTVLAAEAIRHFGRIERLARVRTMLFIAYCVIVALHAVLVFNHQACVFTPSRNLQSWSKAIYGDRTPPAECIKLKL